MLVPDDGEPRDLVAVERARRSAGPASGAVRRPSRRAAARTIVDGAAKNPTFGLSMLVSGTSPRARPAARLRRPAVDLQALGHRRAELDEPVVEEGDAHLERVRHRRAVEVVEHVVGERRAARRGSSVVETRVVRRRRRPRDCERAPREPVDRGERGLDERVAARPSRGRAHGERTTRPALSREARRRRLAPRARRRRSAAMPAACPGAASGSPASAASAAFGASRSRRRARRLPGRRVPPSRARPRARRARRSRGPRGRRPARRGARRARRGRPCRREKESSSSWWSVPNAAATSRASASSLLGVLAEADRERLDRLVICLRHQRDDEARVEPPAEHRAERHVAHQPEPDRLASSSSSSLRVLRERSARWPAVGQRVRQYGSLDDAPSAIDEPVAGQQLVDSRERRARRRDEPERQVGVDRVVVELDRRRARSRARLFSSDAKTTRSPTSRVVERLDPEAVAREHGAPPRGRPRPRCANLPAQALAERVAVALVEVREDLGVAAAREAGAPLARARDGVEVVVELTVLHRQTVPSSLDTGW